jgi:hypothetical protein
MTEEIRPLATHDGRQARLRIQRPDNAGASACVLINSGRVSRFDADLPETRLYQALGRALCRHGITTFEPDLPERDPHAADPTEHAIGERLGRLRDLLGDAVFAPFRADYSVVALSLGGQVMLRQLADAQAGHAPASAILIGTVLEAPAIVAAGVRRIHLVYGEHDCVGYLEPEADHVQFQRPAVYAPRSREKLVVRRSQQVDCLILDGCGHALDRIGPGAADPLDALLGLLVPAAVAL